MDVDVSLEKKKELFFIMLRVRRVQARIESLYLQDEMKTPVHLCIGQEAIAAGVCAAMNIDDYISSNHRGHGHYLAKGGDLNAMIAELHCKQTGCSKGYGGSMHLVDTSVGHLGSSSIVGGGIPIGTGLGLAIQMEKSKKVSSIFFGDGAADEGVLYESINFAILKKLPVIFVLENNHWAVCSHVSQRQHDKNIFHGAPSDSLYAVEIDGNSVLEVYGVAKQAVKRARDGLGPSFIECKTYRILGHAGCAAQDANGYRDTCEIEEWAAKCPVTSFQAYLLEHGALDPDQIQKMEERIDAEIDAAFMFAQKSALPEDENIHNYLFSE